MSTKLTVPQDLPGVELTETERLLKMLVFGHSGVGKTRLALTFCEDPRTSPVLWLDPTGGTTGIADQAKAHGASIRVVEAMDSVTKFTDWLIANKGGGFKTLVVDDFSECFSLTKETVAKQTGKTSAADLDPRDHPKLYERALKIFRALRKVATPVAAGGAGVHIVVTCWAEFKLNNQTQEEYWVPRFAGQFGYQTPAYFDVVTYLESKVKASKDPATKEVTHTFSNTLNALSDQHLVKDRFNLIGARMEMPTATKILDRLLAAHTNS